MLLITNYNIYTRQDTATLPKFALTAINALIF
jgi:hypothetical protein